VQRIRDASVEALAAVPGISAALAQQIKTALSETNPALETATPPATHT